MLIRGGTSKGVFINAADLPHDPVRRDKVVLSIFGSPDARQINGLGGADPLTSKVAIVSRSERDDCDVEYLFGQVGIDKAEIGYLNNCGNLSSAVGLFAVESGLLETSVGEMTVRIFNVNTGKRILADMQIADGQVVTDGDFHIDGVPGTGAPIRLTFCEPAGAVTGSLLPTGNALDTIHLDSGEIEVSIVDCGNLYTFVPAPVLGLSGDESAADIESRDGIGETMDAMRSAVSNKLVEVGAITEEKGLALRKGLKVAIVADGKSVTASDGQERNTDVVSRILNPGKVHKSFAVTGAVAMAGAAAIADSVVGRLLSPMEATGEQGVTIGHPQGAIDAEVQYELNDSQVAITGATVYRTARCIMRGVAYLPGSFDESWSEKEKVA
jgi:hypothetical protein